MRRKAAIKIYSEFDDLIRKTADKNSVSYRTTKKMFDDVITSMVNNIADGKKVTIPKLGSFYVKERKEYQIKDINTGDFITIPSANKIKYNPSKWITNQINYR